MKQFQRMPAALLAFVLSIACLDALRQGEKPNIVILATSGTIASAPATGAKSEYASGQVTIDAMLNSVHGIRDLANLKGEQVANVGSQDMSFDIMLKLAKRINQLLSSNDVDGIVVTHGTGTMEEAALFFNLTVKSDKPVVMVGSKRPSTAVNVQGPLNLYNAVAVAADPRSKGRGVLVVMNDCIRGEPARQLCRPTDARPAVGKGELWTF
jgi:L-asparaginase